MPIEKSAAGSAAAGGGGRAASSRRPVRKRRGTRSSRRKRALQLALKRERAAEAKQSEQFSRAAAFFQSGKFGMARRILERVRSGPNAGLGHRAGVYIAVCNRRTARKRVRLTTLEEHYNYAVTRVNAGYFDEAVRVCNRALAKNPEAAHVHYLKSVANILSGRTSSGVLPLKKALALDPDIRIFALQDPDMEAVVETNPYARLLAG